MVGVAQLVEHLVVVQDVAGSSPVTHPTRERAGFPGALRLFADLSQINSGRPERPGGSVETRPAYKVFTRPRGWLALALALIVSMGYAVSLADAAPLPAVSTALPGHSALVSSQPADGASLATGPTEIVLTFNENINPSFTQVALTRGEGAVTLSPAKVAGPVVRATLADPGPGAYRIAFRVVSADGHPISGETRFTVTGQAAASPTTTPSGAPAPTLSTSPLVPSLAAPSAPSPAAPAASDAQPATGTGSSRPTGFLIAGALIAIAGTLVVWDRKRR